ncbi:hypothetical protein R3W88_013546 [Solanum pinnatisectum]|uniref:Uncharacterized protein n=1 Tax=Solanum pinnatisectum TaxID=50273 RepID=A0AAV9KPI0_9SOLN|nr:hypothetical protein R3W88_013546 [Solanum pinnatisectum]
MLKKWVIMSLLVKVAHFSSIDALLLQIHPSSVLFLAKPECVVFNELVHHYVRNVSRID